MAAIFTSKFLVAKNHAWVAARCGIKWLERPRGVCIGGNRFWGWFGQRLEKLKFFSYWFWYIFAFLACLFENSIEVVRYWVKSGRCWSNVINGGVVCLTLIARVWLFWGLNMLVLLKRFVIVYLGLACGVCRAPEWCLVGVLYTCTAYAC